MIDTTNVQDLINQAIEASVASAVDALVRDPEWKFKIEKAVSQAMVQRVVLSLSSSDIPAIVHERVNEIFNQRLLTNFASTGIDDQATACKLTIFDDTTVFENQLVAQDIKVIGSAVINDLAVTGTINVDNRSWHDLAKTIAEKTLEDINEEWQAKLIDDVKNSIVNEGINFNSVKVGDEQLIDNGALSKSVIKSNIQELGVLNSLTVKGQTSLNDVLTVSNNRVGINTPNPDSALSIWDEEVAIVASKYKKDEAFIGTSRKQSLNLGTNRDPHITIDTDGLTTIKKLRIGQHTISHSIQVPGWTGTRGDIVFNASPEEGKAFAWVCLGSFNWREIKIA